MFIIKVKGYPEASGIKAVQKAKLSTFKTHGLGIEDRMTVKYRRRESAKEQVRIIQCPK